MTYTEVVFTFTSPKDYQQDLLINALAEAGFDTFEETESGFKAYIETSVFEEKAFHDVLASFAGGLNFSTTVQEIKQENWNQVWESNFSPIAIADRCYIRATFHPAVSGFPYEIIIDPKMAFGTGHHQTTAMVIELMLQEEFKNKTVLDMGCGTGILAILADKLGALDVTAIDNDPICYESTLENSKLNQNAQIAVLCGSAEIIPDKTFDIILANINRNILLMQISTFAEVLNNDGKLILSGFYQEDLPVLESEAQKFNLKLNKAKSNDNWVAAQFVKMP